MAARAHAMTSPIDPRPRSHASLLQRLGLVLMIAVLAAASLAGVYLANRTIVPAVLSVAAVIGVGLISGFAARWVLRPHTGLLRLAAALATLAIGLLILGAMTRGSAGLSPASLWQTTPDWIGLARLATGAITALLALRAWSAHTRPAPGTAGATTPQSAETRPPLWQRPIIRMQAWSDHARIQWKESSLFRWLDRTKVRVSTRRTQEDAPARERRAALSVAAPRQDQERGWNRLRWPAVQLPWSRNRMGLKFTSTTEHKCPYCLQTIEPRDRVVTCKTCHTPHHADCWAITGVCQIPHSHN